MKQYTISFAHARTYYDFFECIIKCLEFPSWCGKNFDAVWDMLTSDIKIPAIINISNASALPKMLLQEYEIFLNLLNEAVQWYKNSDYHLEIKMVE